MLSRPMEQKRIVGRCDLGTAEFKTWRCKACDSILGASEKSPALLLEKARHAALPVQCLTLPLLNAVLALPVLSFDLRFLWNEGVRDGGREVVLCLMACFGGRECSC